MPISFRHALALGFTLALASLAVVGVVSYRSTLRLLEESEAVGQTHAQLAALNALLASFREAEANQRAFILTTDSAGYLPSYQAALRLTRDRLAVLRSEPVDAEVRRLGDELASAIARRTAQMEERIELRRRRGLEATVADIRSRGLDRTFQSVAQEIERRERAILARRQSVAAETAATARRVIVLGTLLASSLMVLAMWMIRRESGGRTAALQVAIEKERELVQLMDALPLGVMAARRDGAIVYVNRSAANLLGSEIELGQPFRMLTDVFIQGSDQRYPAERWPLERALEGEATQVSDMEVRAGAREIPLEVTGAPIVDEQGTVKYAIVVLADISDRRTAQRMKDEFLSIVSHELRTPLTSIRGALGLLASGKLGEIAPKGQRMLDIAVADTDRLIRLVSDILDLERLQSGQLAYERQRVDAAELTRRAIESVRPLAERAGVRIQHTADSVQLWADPDRVVQALINLIGNAIKFSPEGEYVTVSVTASDHVARFLVRDQGRGVPPDKLKAIFARFQQVDPSDARTKGGAGLGLAISQSIVEHHGGRIWVESDGSHGSSFYFTLPLQHENVSPTAAGGAAPLVLLAECDASTLELMRSNTIASGYDVISVDTGSAVIERAAAETPAVIVLNLLCTELNGHHTLAELARRRDTSNIPVVALREPLNMQDLVSTLDRALVQQRGVNVLVIEDDENTTRQLVNEIARRGMLPLTANSVATAQEMVRRRVPDLIILDFLLPDATGYQLIKNLRRDPGLAQTPLIVYSAAALDIGAQFRLRLGPTEFFRKERATPAEVAHRAVLLFHQSRLGSRALSS